MPLNINSFDEFTRFPFTDAGHISKNPLSFLCVSQNEIERVVTLTSSGTSGPPKRLYFTSEDLEQTMDFFLVGMSTFTGSEDKVLILLPGERPDSVGDLLCRALQRGGVRAVKHGPVHDAEKTLAVIKKEAVTCLVGIPTQVLWLARCQKHPDPVVADNIKSVLLSTDYVPRAICSALESTWNCNVYNHYGMTEMGLGGSVDCEARQGGHLREADLFFEVIDPETGCPVSPGEYGEVVFTTLTRKGMPLIRYRTGDMARFLNTPCPCGTFLPRLDRVRGRIQDRVALGPKRQLYIADLDEALFQVPECLNYQARLKQQNGTTILSLSIFTPEAVPNRFRDDICRSLKSIPAIRDGIKNNDVTVGDITVSTHNWFTDGTVKRKIRVE